MKQLSTEFKATVAAALVLAVVGLVFLVVVVEPAWLLWDLDRGGDPVLAKARLERLLAKDPLNLRVQGYLLPYLIDSGDMTRADSILINLQSKDPYGYLTARGECEMKLAKGVGDNRVCERALRESNGTVRDLNDMASMYLRTRSRLGETVKLLEEARAMEPKNAKVLNNLGLAQLMLKHYDLAYPILMEALRLQPDSLVTRKNLARLYYERSSNCQVMEDCRRSLLELEHVLLETPYDQDTLITIAIIYAMNYHNLETAYSYALKSKWLCHRLQDKACEERADSVIQEIEGLKAGEQPTDQPQTPRRPPSRSPDRPGQGVSVPN